MASTFSAETQTNHVRKRLLSGAEINHSMMIAEVEAHRTAAIIHYLKSKQNWPIVTRYGHLGEAFYRLGKDFIQNNGGAHV